MGSPTVQASYSGDVVGGNGNGPSTGTTSITVNKAASSVAVGCAPSTVPVGSYSTCTASVGGYSPTGTVIFTQTSGSAKTSLTSPVSCSLTGATCQVNVSTFAAGGASITAAYSGDGNNQPSTGGVLLSVSPVSSTTTLNCTPATLIAGQQTTCTATVVGYGPTGIVTWLSSDKGGIFSANPCSLTSGSCGVFYTPTTSALITASYSGDQNNGGSQGTFSITANVNEMIQITVANSGPSTTVALSGCSVTPSAIPTDGMPHSFQAASGCSPITVNLPTPGTNSRYVAAGGVTSLTIGGCASVSCQTFTATIYFQVQNAYQATPKNPSSWSTPGVIQVNGTQLGTSGQNICSISVTTGAGQFSCQGWTDYNSQVVIGILQVSQNQRWATTQNSFTDATGGNQHNANYYSQVLENFQYSVAGSGTAPSAPVLNFTAFGAPGTSPLIGSASSVWIDAGSTWSVPAALPGSSASERWDSSLSSGPSTAGATVSFLYYHQYLVNFAFSIIGGGTAYTFPSVSFTSFGSPTKGVQSWVDAGSAYNYTSPLIGSSNLERWFTPTYAGSISGPGTILASYYHQYAFVLSYGVVGGGVFNNPRLSYTALGIDEVAQVTGVPASLWLDATTSWSVNAQLPSSTSTERWITRQTTSGTVSAPMEAQLTYHHEYLGTLSYSIKGAGGSPPVPRLNYTTYGANVLTDMPTTPTGFWMDSASAMYLPSLLPGNPGERWISNVTASLVAGAPFHLDAQYTHQFFVQVGATGGGAVVNTNQWHDQGSTVLLNATAAKYWSFAYWRAGTPFSYNGTELLSNLLVTGPANETAIFFPGLTITTDELGSVSYSFGKINGTVHPGSEIIIYPPPGRNVTVTALPNTVEIMFQGWTGALSNTQLRSSVATSSPALLKATFVTDYNDIRTFAIAAIGVFIAAAYVFIIKRGFAPRIAVPRT